MKKAVRMGSFFHFIRKIPLLRCEISHRQRDPAQLYPAHKGSFLWKTLKISGFTPFPRHVDN